MATENQSVTELAVSDRVVAAQEQIAALQAQLDKLPADKGPELKPSDGPSNVSRGHQRVTLEKQILQAKEDALTDIDQMLENAPPDIKEHCEQVVGKWLYPEEIGPDQQKDLETSQTMLARKVYEKKYPEKPLEQGDKKTMDQAERSIWRQRYKTEMPEPDHPEKPLAKEDKKDPDTSQRFAFSLRYPDHADDDGSTSGNNHTKDDKNDLEPDKD